MKVLIKDHTGTQERELYPKAIPKSAAPVHGTLNGKPITMYHLSGRARGCTDSTHFMLEGKKYEIRDWNCAATIKPEIFTSAV